MLTPMSSFPYHQRLRTSAHHDLFLKGALHFATHSFHQAGPAVWNSLPVAFVTHPFLPNILRNCLRLTCLILRISAWTLCLLKTFLKGALKTVTYYYYYHYTYIQTHTYAYMHTLQVYMHTCKHTYILTYI